MDQALTNVLTDIDILFSFANINQLSYKINNDHNSKTVAVSKILCKSRHVHFACFTIHNQVIDGCIEIMVFTINAGTKTARERRGGWFHVAKEVTASHELHTCLSINKTF